MVKFRIIRSLLPIVAISLGLPGPGPAKAQGQIDADTKEIVEAVSASLAAAESIKVTGTRSVDEALLGSSSGKEEVDFELSFVRPNKLHVSTVDEAGTRLFLYDGATVSLVEKEQKLYATADLEAPDITALAEAMSKRFGFYPPVAEFLAANPAEQLLDNVTEGTMTTAGDNTLLAFAQEDLKWEMLIAGDSKLPLRLTIHHTEIEGQPQFEVIFSEWELDADLADTAYSVEVGEDFQKIEIVPIPED